MTGETTMSNDRNWTSFNQGKLFYHIERWKNITSDGQCPPPALITVDPSNYCNLACEWCNACKVRENKRQISRKTLLNAADFFAKWKSPDKKHGVNAICIAGGGEPLTNPHVGEFLNCLHKKQIKCATVTNGLLIDNFYEELLNNQYVAVSVDAGTAETFNKYKGTPKNGKHFEKVISNIEQLCKLARNKKCNLNDLSPSNGVNYRMLIYKDNIKEISIAAQIVQELGCKNFHIRPASVPYDGNIDFHYTPDEIKEFKEQIEIVNNMKNRRFGFYYTLGKFDDKFSKNNDFKHCHAIFMTATLMPPINNGSEDGYCLNICCDRRSDKLMRLLTNEEDINNIAQIWGSKEHWEKFKEITKDVIQKHCPRCTYYSHNKIFENCIEENKDNMLLDFI